MTELRACCGCCMALKIEIFYYLVLHRKSWPTFALVSYWLPYSSKKGSVLSHLCPCCSLCLECSSFRQLPLSSPPSHFWTRVIISKWPSPPSAPNPLLLCFLHITCHHLTGYTCYLGYHLSFSTHCKINERTLFV